MAAGEGKLLPPRLIPFLAAMRLKLLVQRHMAIAGLRITVRQMPAPAVFAAVHP